MCGIAGFWARGMNEPEQIASQMTDEVAHRGPDASGVWVDPQSGIALGHRRLAVVDLSEAGNQPMHSPDGRFVISYNGEIYNHLELREQLGAQDWRGHSDTETLVTAISAWGLEETLKRAVGMFALAVYDRETRRLRLARDRIGEKPLYYGSAGQAFLFGSELKALAKFPGWKGEIDRAALTSFLRYAYVPAPLSIYRGVKKLLPGHIVTIEDYGQTISTPEPYWRLEDHAFSAKTANPRESIAMLHDLLLQSVKSQMLADVPLGAFLSGGIDSSTIVALMQSLADQPVKTFAIGFEEAEFDESQHAKAVAQHLGTDHTELTVTPQAMLDVIPRLPSLWDEPFGDSSQIPTYLVSRLAREMVTVSLSGDGGDELFGGYQRYRRIGRAWSAIASNPLFIRRVLAAVIGATPVGFANRLSKFRIEQRLASLQGMLRADCRQSAYREVMSRWKSLAGVVIDRADVEDFLLQTELHPPFVSFRDWMMYADAKTYLPDDILTKVDRASMAVSLEARVPMLDHRVVEFAMRLPASLKWREGQSKWLLRQVLYQYVPRELIDRPKMGFGVPVGKWLRGPLKEWAGDLLSPDRLNAEGYFQLEEIQRAWQDHLSGRSDNSNRLWVVLMFQAWLEHQ